MGLGHDVFLTDEGAFYPRRHDSNEGDRSLNTEAGVDPVRSYAAVVSGLAADSQRLHRRLSPFDTLLLTLS
jgi:hypothetical protein